MKIDREIMSGLEEYFISMLKNAASGRRAEPRDAAIDVALKLSQLILNLKAIQGAELQENVMENMKDIDFSKVDINGMLKDLMGGGM